ncbi:MAG: EAL domain-containing protein, partial [Gammaproteobacteria bacterium]|nr:EAL domain-containing protein [Gammaproteobacteria bacterium]
MAPPPDNESIEDRLKQFIKLAEKNPDAVVIVTIDGSILYANPASKPLLQKCCSVDVKTDLEKMMPLVADTLASGETQCREIDCKGMIYSFYIVPFPDEECVALYGRDITERKHIDEKLRQGEQRLALVMRGTNDGIWDFDLKTGEIYFSPRWKKMLGYRENEIPHRFNDWQDLIHPEDLGRVLDVWVDCMEGLTDSFWVEYRIRAKAGDYIWVLCRGLALRDDSQTPVRLAGSHTDITDRRRAEEALKQSEARFAGIFDIANEAIVSVDESQRIILFNKQAEQAFGYTADEVMGLPLDMLIPKKFQARHRTYVNDFSDSSTVAQKMRESRDELYGLRKNGEEFPARISISKFNLGDEKIFTAVVQDITVTKQREEAIKNIVLGTSTSIGESFFEAITVQLAKTLGADFAIVGELATGGESIKTLSVCAEGKIVDNFEYDLLHTPCAHVLGKETCSYPCSVAELFPKDEKLENMGVEGYIGVPLFGSRGQPLGLLIALSRTPIEHIEYTESIVQIFAARTAAEIERMHIETRMEYLAYHDDLTNLPNRTLIFDRLEQALARAAREDTLGALLFIDLDGFKTINDSLGHPTGDLLLKEIGRRLLRQQRFEDSVGRMGGDEFVVLLPNLGTNRDSVATDVQAIAEKIRGCLAKPVFIDNHELRVTLSIGIVLFPYDADNAEDLLSQADTAMYRAKEQGRDMIRFYHPAMQLRVMERLALQNDLHNAINNNELQLYFQPQVDILTGQIIGAEALLRWQHPGRGMVSPAEFIPLAEETSQILTIGTWVLKAACMQLREFTQTQRGGHKNFSLSVNVSPYQFRQEDFVDLVRQFASKAGIDPASLTLEFTEGMLMHDTEDVGWKLDALKALGVRLAIDDFGTGYSSLSYLKCFPLDILKIDQSFVRDISTDTNDAAIVRAIILMAESLNLRVIAEGVETQTQLDFLKKEGCLSCQG